jgi:uroporphyrinogen-III synthase
MPEMLPAGFGVLVTRPRAQSMQLADAIRQRGGKAYIFPSIEIVAREPGSVALEVKALPPADITIFVSRNAVQHGIRFAQGKLAAIGPTTAAEIRQSGHAVDICPATGYDSEHLLAEPGFSDVRGKSIRIIRGNTGRDLLARELRARGAKVDYLASYERRLPEYSAAEVSELESHWHEHEIQAIVVMSVQSYECLQLLLSPSGRTLLGQTAVVTPATRVQKEVQHQHPDCPVFLCAGPRVDDIVECIAAAANSTTNPP